MGHVGRRWCGECGRPRGEEPWGGYLSHTSSTRPWSATHPLMQTHAAESTQWVNFSKASVQDLIHRTCLQMWTPTPSLFTIFLMILINYLVPDQIYMLTLGFLPSHCRALEEFSPWNNWSWNKLPTFECLLRHYLAVTLKESLKLTVL